MAAVSGSVTLTTYGKPLMSIPRAATSVAIRKRTSPSLKACVCVCACVFTCGCWTAAGARAGCACGLKRRARYRGHDAAALAETHPPARTTSAPGETPPLQQTTRARQCKTQARLQVGAALLDRPPPGKHHARIRVLLALLGLSTEPAAPSKGVEVSLQIVAVEIRAAKDETVVHL